jgi:Ion channel
MASADEDRTARGRRTPLRTLAQTFASLDSYGLLLVAIVVTYALSVSLEGARSSSIALLAQMLTLWLAIHTSRAGRALVVVTTALLVLGAVAAITSLFSDQQHPIVLVEVASILLYALAPFVILRRIVLRNTIDSQSLLGALAAYLMLGMFFAFDYRFIGTLQNTAFFGANGRGTTAQCLFFSFTTLTTTGYGNLVPAGNPGQTLAVVEMVTGQLFLIVAIGKLITAWKPKRFRPED